MRPSRNSVRRRPEILRRWNPDVWKDQIASHPLDCDLQFHAESFEEAVRQCVEYIRAGDIFQVVPSQRLVGQNRRRPVRDLPLAARRQSQPLHVLRAHPRLRIGRLLARDHVPSRRPHSVTVRPLAGTRRRGADGKRRQGTRARTTGRSQRARRTCDAGRFGTKRRRPGRRVRLDRIDRSHGRRTLQPRDAHQQ